ncbi:hypothetical protein AMTR_s00072p00126590 [Amborella trichopoda]|uniref:Zinc finger PMZ-type domain-containing protein n=1 Tax=Amborella trichopoda TaxID=13333 RepID=W1NTG2_AMBTC|nr:hypothetical protein AMTR_s00072p00126590 [Amborella trichopoda]
MLGLDGTFLKGTYLGVLLAAIDLDANGGTFHVAIAVLVDNFKRTWKSKVLLKEWWQAASALSTESWILEEREMPLIPLCENLRIKLLKRWAERQLESEQWDSVLVPKAQDVLNERITKSRFGYNVIWVVDIKYKVHEEMAHAVDLDARTCTCRVWRNSGFPCTYEIGAMNHCHLHPLYFCEPYFRVQAYRTTYATEFHLVPDSVPLTGAFNRIVYPPITKRYLRRPKKQRRQTEEKSTKVYICKYS